MKNSPEVVSEASDPTTSGVLWSRLAKLFTLLSLKNSTYESHERVDRAMRAALEDRRPFAEDHLLEGLTLLGKEASVASAARGPWRGVVKDDLQRDEEETVEGVRRILAFYDLRDWLCSSSETNLVMMGEEEKVVIGEKKKEEAVERPASKNGLVVLDRKDETSKVDTGEDEEAKQKMMRNMAHLWLQQEVHELECDVGDRRQHGGTLLSGFAHYSPYLVVDHLALSAHLGLVKELVASRRFALVVPVAVIHMLDEMKKEDVGARTAMRWLEKQFRDGKSVLG